MNIDTDTQFAMAEGMGKYYTEHTNAFHHQLDPESGEPLKKYYDPRKWTRAAEVALVERLTEAFADLGATGKSIAQA
jgi:fructose-bisphosphate aldolase class II